MKSEIGTPPAFGSTNATLLRRRRKKQGLLVSGMLLGAMLCLPTEARGDIFSVFTSIFGLISGSIGGSLSAINTVAKDTQSLYQKTVWPLQQLNSARGFIANTTTTYRSYMKNIFKTNLRSATLQVPQQLETVLRSRDTSQLAMVQTGFPANYGSVPPAGAASPQDRLLVDVDDAIGAENLKGAIVSDQQQDTALKIADSLENQAAVSTPGTTPFLTASAQVANLRCMAYMHRMLAGELRQEAARIAHDNTLIKRSSQSAATLSNQVTGVLSR